MTAFSHKYPYFIYYMLYKKEILMDIKDITSENYEQFKYVFWLDWSNKVKYIDLFKRGIISGDTLGHLLY